VASASGLFLTAASVAVAAALIVFSLRRILLLAASLLPGRPAGAPRGELPSVAVVVPTRNEGANVESLLAALDRLDYPSESMFVVLVDDCSDDSTGRRLVRWTADRLRALALELPTHAGKASALNAGVSTSPSADLIAVCDADLRPRPDWLLRLVGYLVDDAVGAATGFLAPGNADSSLVARYATVESWTHQLVTSAGKDRLDLNPPMLGASIYRRTALEQVGGFRPDAPGEDVHATVALTRAGWRTRFAPDAVAENSVADSLRDYWHQHIRWARNVFAARSNPHGSAFRERRSRRGAAPVLRQTEVWASSMGYADRLAFLGAAALAAAGALPLWLPAASLAVAASEAAGAVVKAGAGARLHRFLVAAAAFFAVDVVASIAATAAHLSGRPRIWRATRRAERTRASA
jgi:cellulose synthase/poly-beta-1,6-N-acetylglucosamine synthase-like glycosyltransferase